jgi:hypothetical protein
MGKLKDLDLTEIIMIIVIGFFLVSIIFFGNYIGGPLYILFILIIWKIRRLMKK